MNQKELQEKAKTAKNLDELMELANQNGIEADSNHVQDYFAKLSLTSNALSDEELDSASGGAHGPDGRMIITAGYKCGHWVCNRCGAPLMVHSYRPTSGSNRLNYVMLDPPHEFAPSCSNCSNCVYEFPRLLCNAPENRC